MVERLRDQHEERERHLCVRCRQDIEVASASEQERGHTMTHVGEGLVGAMVDQELDTLMMALQ